MANVTAKEINANGDWEKNPRTGNDAVRVFGFSNFKEGQKVDRTNTTVVAWEAQGNSIEVTPFVAPVLTLEQVKEAKKNVIDLKTSELISEGFQYEGKIFSLSTNAQNNWNALDTAVSTGKLVEANFPIDVSTLAGDEIYELAWLSFNGFIIAGLNTVMGRLASGNALKKLVNAAATVEEVDAIVDNRTTAITG